MKRNAGRAKDMQDIEELQARENKHKKS